MSSEHPIPCSEYRPSVLIAQSNEADLQTIVEACKEFDGFDVATATTGQGIIDQINELCFDAIVLGLKFPDITGATVAYLIHQFDPLVSVAFLSSYKSDILISVAQDLGFKFWSKDEKMEDLEAFCDDICNLALEIPCDDTTRIIKREFSRPEREQYLQYRQLLLPNSISQVVEEHKARKLAIHG